MNAPAHSVNRRKGCKVSNVYGYLFLHTEAGGGLVHAPLMLEIQVAEHAQAGVDEPRQLD